MQLIVNVPEDIYNQTRDDPIGIFNQENNARAYDLIRCGVPLDSVTTQIERLKHEYPDITGYRWWNNAIDNCLHLIRDECEYKE